MSNNAISSQIRMEYTPGRGVHFPDTAMRDRGINPSFGDGTSFIFPHAESVTLTIAIGALASGATATVSGSQQLNLSSLNMAGTDIGWIVFTNISATGPTNVIISHPKVTLTSTQGTISAGSLAAGQDYTNLSISATVPVYAAGASSAGTITITAVMLVLGTRTQ